MTAQVPIANPITIDSARALLGTDPVAVPNTPARFYAMPKHAVIVVQDVDSELSVAFRKRAALRRSRSIRRCHALTALRNSRKMPTSGCQAVRSFA
jgi:hypothetical protein